MVLVLREKMKMLKHRTGNKLDIEFGNVHKFGKCMKGAITVIFLFT